MGESPNLDFFSEPLVSDFVVGDFAGFMVLSSQILSVSEAIKTMPNTALEPTPRTLLGLRKASGCCCLFVWRGSAFGR